MVASDALLSAITSSVTVGAAPVHRVHQDFAAHVPQGDTWHIVQNHFASFVPQASLQTSRGVLRAKSVTKADLVSATMTQGQRHTAWNAQRANFKSLTAARTASNASPASMSILVDIRNVSSVHWGSGPEARQDNHHATGLALYAK